MNKTNFYFEKQFNKNVESIRPPFATEICNCIWNASCVQSVLLLLYEQVLKRSRVFPDPAWLKIDNKQFRIFIYGFHFIPRVVASTLILLFHHEAFIRIQEFKTMLFSRIKTLKLPANRLTSFKHRFESGLYINSDEYQAYGNHNRHPK